MDAEYKLMALLTNTLYLLSQAMDLIMRYLERLMVRKGNCFKHEKKQLFNRYLQAVKMSYILNEDLCQDIYKHEAERNYEGVQMWQEQSNEMARFILLLANISPYPKDIEETFNLLRSFKGEGIVTDDVLKNFYLKS